MQVIRKLVKSITNCVVGVSRFFKTLHESLWKGKVFFGRKLFF